jgi:hypothetical protein
MSAVSDPGAPEGAPREALGPFGPFGPFGLLVMVMVALAVIAICVLLRKKSTIR